MPAASLSPCVQVCSLNDHGYCLGCRRSLAEIAAWARMTAAEKLRIMRELPDREV